MKLQHNQKGSSVTGLLLIAVAIGLVGFIGWFVWHSQQAANTVLDDTNTSTPATVPAGKGAATKSSSRATLVTVKADGGRVSVKAPSNWVVATKPSDTPELNYPETVTITAPDGDTYVRFIRYGGLGGACLPEENKQTITKLASTKLAGDAQLMFVQYYISDTNGGYYVANIMKSDTAAGIVENANVCSAFLAQMMPDFKGADIGAANFGIFSKKLQAKVDSDAKITAAEYDSFVTSSDYTAAKEILLSLTD